ncbi:MAG: polysaccharide deacetylase family protein [Solirubrobacterales bacterium]
MNNKKKWMGTLFIIFLFSAAAYIIMNSTNFQFFGGIVNRLPTDKKIVALTFDDGPTEKTDEILSILKSENIKATFFLIGSEIEKNQEETKNIISDGQEVGNHTYTHKRMIFKTYGYIKDEIEGTDKLIRKMGYNDTIQFRPPNGKKLVLLPFYLNANNRKTILWDLTPNSYDDINSSSDKIVKYVMDNVKPGSIILLHPMNDKNKNTINSIKPIIKGLKEKGYEFVTINQIIN